jgi:hypothetical protein
MNPPEFSLHAKAQLAERKIPAEWVWRTIYNSDKMDLGLDGNMHYLKSISERDGRILRVVVNQSVDPSRIVTVFFDRRLKRIWRKV